MSPTDTQGFSILEVMIAVAILAVALTAIFSSQVGAINVAQRARHTGVATLLARCKMGELEEKFTKEGFPINDVKGSDRCCRENADRNFQCTWSVDRVLLPAPPPSSISGFGADGGTPEMGKPSTPFDINSAMSAAGIAGGGGKGMIGQLALQFALPILKPIFETQLRRFRVKVSWREGTKPLDFSVNQFVVLPTPGTGAAAALVNQALNPGTRPPGASPGGLPTAPPISPSTPPARSAF